MSRIIPAALLAIALSACASNHDLKKGPNTLGGGIEDTEVLPGLHHIIARTNWAPWEKFGAARKSWKKLADRACGIGSYKELGTTEAARDTGIQPMGALAYIVTEKTGYALCNGTGTTEAQALALIETTNSPAPAQAN
jgi:hypothetical protein